MPTSARSAAALVAALLVGLVVPAAAQAAPGDLDPSFSGDGKQTTDFVGFSWARATVLQPDGKIVAVGQDAVPGVDFALARYNPNGSLDPTFSGDGKQRLSFGPRDDAATGVALQQDGKIVVVGIAEYDTGAGTGEAFAVARYNPNGSLDPTFSGDGQQITKFGRYTEAFGVALQADGKIVVVGRTCVTAPSGSCSAFNFAVARYNPNGSLDPSFSGDGKQTTDFGGYLDIARAVVLEGAKILVVGAGDDGDGDAGFALARYNPNGSLDPTFSGDGRQLTLGLTEANAVALQANGKIVAAGSGPAPLGASDPALARYNPNGTLDKTFSGDGKLSTDFSGFENWASGVALQANGKIVAVGSGADDFALTRYNPNGTLDATFSGNGKQTTDFGAEDVAYALALQPNGKIVAVGSTDYSHFALARYLGG
jgi:uncharacterized delta-60 repeat protein